MKANLARNCAEDAAVEIFPTTAEFKTATKEPLQLHITDLDGIKPKYAHLLLSSAHCLLELKNPHHVFLCYSSGHLRYKL